MIAPLKQNLQPGQTLIGTGVAEAFFIEMKVGLVGGLFVASPVIFYQIWRFLAPGLLGDEKKLVVPFVVCATFFFLPAPRFAITSCCRSLRLLRRAVPIDRGLAGDSASASISVFFSA
jgi:Sec-independent protein secretion pathway component TatC